MLERIRQLLLTKRQLAHRPNLRVWLEVLPNLAIEAASLDSDDLGGGVRIVRDGAAALRAEDAVHVFAAAALAAVGLGRAADGQLGLGDDGDERVGRAGLALAVVAVVVADDVRGGDVDSEGGGFAEAVAGERHVGRSVCDL